MVSRPVRSISSTLCSRSRTNAMTAPRSRGVRSKQDYSRMLMNRVALEIGDTLVEREQDPIGSNGGIDNCRVCRTAKSFAGGRVGIMAQSAKIRHQFNREVLVKLELHLARIGTRRSSCANSAA